MSPLSSHRALSPSKSQIRNAALMLLAAALAPMLVTGVINLYQFKSAYESKVRDHLEVTIERHCQNIDSFLNDRLSDIRVITREYPPEELRKPQVLRRLLSLLREEYHGAFVDMGLVDAQGIQVAYAGPFNLEMADYSDAVWFADVQQHEHIISDVFTGLRGTPHFIVAVNRRHGEEQYTVRATIDFEAFNALVESIRIGRTGFAFIFNRKGEFQTSPSFEVALNRSPYIDLLEGRISRDHVATVEGPDIYGRVSIFTIAPLKGGQWFLAYQQERSDAIVDLRRAQTVAVVVFAVAAAVAVGLAIMLSRLVTVRLAEADRRSSIISEKVIETGRLASIGELAAGIAHEINNPVAIMVEEAGWIADLLEDGEIASEEGLREIQRAVGQIKTQGDRCKEITYKLLSFARKTDPTVRKLNLNRMVEEIVGLMGQKTRYANVMIESTLDPDLPPISASPTEMQQVLLNLVNNAVDAIGQHGGKVTISTSSDGDDVVLEVADTGGGIPEANLARIFDPFFTTKPVGQGTGLGLSICYGIVDKLGGRISVESEVERGTTFRVYLPSDERGLEDEGSQELLPEGFPGRGTGDVP